VDRSLEGGAHRRVLTNQLQRRLREKAARAKTDEWQAIDTEIKRHRVPSDADSKMFSSLLVGQWQSPRHDFLYRADGTWTMLPEEKDVTHGR
jgi:hypothetical protein